jgi:hypothetical protein
MTAVAHDEMTAVVRELAQAADTFAGRAAVQERLRDAARPGSAVQHHHAHAATLWRCAETSIRERIGALSASPAR